MKGSNRAIAPLLRDVLDGLRSEPGRAGLSFLAVTTGIVALTLLLAILGGLKEKSRLLIHELGANVMAVIPQQTDPAKSGPYLTKKSADVLAASLPKCRVSDVRFLESEMPGVEKSVTISGCDSLLAAVRGWRMAEGRFLDPVDLRSGERAVVVSAALAREQRWKVGNVISIQHTPFTVVGIVDAGADALARESGEPVLSTGQRSVFIPLTAPVDWGEAGQGARDRIDTVFIQVPPETSTEQVMPVVQRVLAAPEIGIGHASWITPELLVRGIRRLQRTIRLAGGGIALLCLVLGGTTLTSLMIANVRDRVAEIGLRRALGATSRDIAALFVAESCLLTVAAATTGTLVVGILVCLGGSGLSTLLKLNGLSFVLPVAVSVILGMVFSWWPARTAAKISPAEALRND